jgi:succinate dehydrogenase / fumarate reductase flavoprotein subunit
VPASRLFRYLFILQGHRILERQTKEMLDAKIPTGPLEEKWGRYRSTARLVSPANRKKFQIVVVGTGLAGSSLAASLGEMGYAVVCLSFHDTARRAHSVAAQGGVNACKNYKNDDDTIFRMFYDTIKGGILGLGKQTFTGLRSAVPT